MRLVKVYATAEKYGMTSLKNELIDLLFTFRRASPRPKPPTSNIIDYVYDTTPTNSPLRKLLVAWYTWHVHKDWYADGTTPTMLSQTPEFAADLTCSMSLKANGMTKSSPLDGKSNAYHESDFKGRGSETETNDQDMTSD